MFLTEEDYIVASNMALNVLQQCSEEKRETAERMAIEEVSGYLRSRYDVKKIFAASGSERNNIIVLRTCDVSLYHLSACCAGNNRKAVLHRNWARNKERTLRTCLEMVGRSTGGQDNS